MGIDCVSRPDRAGPPAGPSLDWLQPQQWSGKRDSNPRPPAWKAGALPLSYSRVSGRPAPAHVRVAVRLRSLSLLRATPERTPAFAPPLVPRQRPGLIPRLHDGGEGRI